MKSVSGSSRLERFRSRRVEQSFPATVLPCWGHAVGGWQAYRHTDFFHPETAAHWPETTEQGVGQQNPGTGALGPRAALSVSFPLHIVPILSSSQGFSSCWWSITKACQFIRLSSVSFAYSLSYSGSKSHDFKIHSKKPTAVFVCFVFIFLQKDKGRLSGPEY